MGCVYSAVDPRLSRTVAIKVLPAHVAGEPIAIERFEREARTLASINHPHIVTIHSVEAADGVRFLTMERVEGQTLAALIPSGGMRLDRLLAIAIPLVDALSAAHEKGITHRDLKPGNVMVTADELVKVLDFGLAKPQAAAATPAGETTTSGPLTDAGVIVGTVAYMSPEQAEGRPVDHRSDLFSLGIILYEMATGERPFKGETTASLLAAIIKDTPKTVTSLNSQIPPALARLIARALVKDPERRAQTAKDLRNDLQLLREENASAALEGTAGRKAQAPDLPRTSVRRRWLHLAATAAIVILAAAIGWSRLVPPPPLAPLMRFEITLPEGDRLDSTATAAIALSPDGRYLLFGAVTNNRYQLFLRGMADADARQFPGQLEGRYPFFSPDGAWAGFSGLAGHMKAAVPGGGPAISVSNVVNQAGSFATWGADGTIVVSPGAAEGRLMRVPASGGPPQPLTTLREDAGELYHRWPRFLPGGRAVLFGVISASMSSFDDVRIEVVRLETGERKTLVQGGYDPRYVPTGHLLFSRAQDVFAVPFDLSRLEVTGDPVRVLSAVATSSGGDAQFSVSDTGTLVLVPRHPGGDERTLTLVDRQGVARPMSAPSRLYFVPRISPDGRRIAVETTDVTHTVWVYDMEREVLNRVNAGHEPSWMPDGGHVAYVDRSRKAFVRQVPDASAPEQALMEITGQAFAGSWSQDGKSFVFPKEGGSTLTDIWALMPGAPQKMSALLATRFEESQPSLSPDARWLAYTSDATGSREVYVQPYPGLGSKWRISTAGGYEPVWARSGRELFYRLDDRVYSVEVSTTPTFGAGRPHLLFQGSYARGNRQQANYDVTPDGKQFVMLAMPRPSTRMQVVLNWFQELTRLAPLPR